MNAKDVIKQAQNIGWEIKTQRGSHVKLVKDNSTVIIPHHGSKDIPIGTLNKILKQLGLK
ncbi:type II toxin-antitoxin system HicA family toxin [Clostridium botulinum]|uniref:Conserved domain protein n=2 Tax=Clostridium botulinum TaxID=1491 RepID=C1FRX7_CLOBJ|nr:type II toxin-antitoxin system HicA family toxin [Clostridium botulinum]ACO83851.1 conserved domain protein [Clostridium botulinum A2 str. Kyoto]AUN07496.1 addiction module toxin, HicA family [Clostridium botulinum]KEI94415.1 toxin HicA [Clostridium botulinum A2B3 87]MBN3364222.1 addiction module toxin, HicA family [Clostridium botulinum]MBN3368396.1 addiction module toxin, HicA family [Clostridium botulinum]